MATNVFFSHRHQQEGSLDLSLCDGVVRLRVNWPIDFATDDWFNTKVDFAEDTFRKGVDEASSSGKAEIEAIGGGFLEIRVKSPSHFYLSFGDGFRRYYDLPVNQFLDNLLIPIFHDS